MQYKCYVWFKVLVTTGLLIVLGSCTDRQSLPYLLEDYQQRLANILDSSAPVTHPENIMHFPSLREIEQSQTSQLTPTNIKLFEFYKLKHCALYSIIAERNTSLGKTQLPSVRFSYEQQLIHALKNCIELTNEPKLKAMLTEWLTIKQANFPLVWTNLIQQSSEIRLALSSNKGWISATDKDGLGPTLESLILLIHAKQLDYTQKEDIEFHLKQLSQYALLAKIWRSQTYMTQQLLALTQWLEEHQEQLTCNSGEASTKVKYLANVLQRYFIDKIQPKATKLNHYHYQLAPHIEVLVTDSHLSNAFKTYLRQHIEQGFSQYQIAMKQHLSFWQLLFKQCNIQPGETFN